MLFADAVGCSRAVLTQLAGLLGSGRVRAALEVTAPESGREGAATAAVAAGSRAGSCAQQLSLSGWFFIADGDTAERPTEQNPAPRVLGEEINGNFTELMSFDAPLQHHLLQQVCQQLEALLFVGFKLDLQQLLQPALCFLHTNVESQQLSESEKASASSASRHITAIFSARVLAAAGGVSGKELLSRACLQQPLGRGMGIGSMFRDVNFKLTSVGSAQSRICFEAVLLQDLCGYKKGNRVTAEFEAYDGTLFLTCSEGSRSTASMHYGVMVAPEWTFGS
jgi:hypothetical protein